MTDWHRIHTETDLPPLGIRVLVTLRHREIMIATLIHYLNKFRWDFEDACDLTAWDTGLVIAWADLPEYYQGEV